MKMPRVVFVSRYFGRAKGGIGQYEEMLFASLRTMIDIQLCPIQPFKVPHWLSLISQALAVDLPAVAGNFPMKVPCARDDGAILHFTNQNMAPALLLYATAPSLITVHDIIPYLQVTGLIPARGQKFSPLSRLQITLFHKSLKMAKRIIANSLHTKNDLVKHLDVDPNKIDLIYLGVDRAMFRPIKKTIGRKRFNISADSRLILYVGANRPHKNLKVLVEALAQIRHSASDMVLLIVGRRSEQDVQLSRLIAHYKLDGQVLFAGFVPRGELPHLYNLADVLVMPSFYEGFGLPVLEAMSCGCPVLSSNSASLPEILGNAGRLVPPHDPQMWAGALREILGDEDMRETMSAAGVERARQFDWKTAAVKTIQAYRSVI